MSIIYSGQIGSGQVDRFAYAPGSILSAHLGSGQVYWASGQIGWMHHAAGAILSAQIGANIIAAGHIANQGLTSSVFASGAVGNTHIASGGVLSANIASGQLGGFHHGAGVLISGNYASGSIGATHIAAGAIVSSVIASGLVALTQATVMSADANGFWSSAWKTAFAASPVVVATPLIASGVFRHALLKNVTTALVNGQLVQSGGVAGTSGAVHVHGAEKTF